jgi:hypothetical protein
MYILRIGQLRMKTIDSRDFLGLGGRFHDDLAEF